MKKKIALEAFLTIVIMTVAVVWLYFAYEIHSRTARIASAVTFGGPATFPIVIGWTMFLCSATLLCHQLIRLLSKDMSTEEAATGDVVLWSDVCRVLALLVAALAYVTVFNVVGFLPSSIVLLAICLLLFQMKNKILLVVLSIVIPVVLYYFFTMVVKIQLP